MQLPFGRFTGCESCLQKGVSLSVLIERGTLCIAQRKWRKLLYYVHAHIGAAAVDMIHLRHRNLESARRSEQLIEDPADPVLVDVQLAIDRIILVPAHFSIDEEEFELV